MRVVLDLLPGADGLIRRHSLRHEPPWRGPAHRHDELEFNLIVKGSASYLIGGMRCTLAPSSLVWIFPGQEHILIRESSDFDSWVAVFRREMVRRIARSVGLPILTRAKPPGHFCRIVDARALRLLSQFMEEMSGERSRISLPQLNAALSWLLMEAWRRFASSRDVPIDAEIHPAVARATAILSEDPTIASVGELARRVGLSPAWLGRIFQANMKISIAAFRNRQRLHAFLRIYGEGRRRNLTEAALEAGFPSYLQFFRVFRELMGISPREFSRRAGGEDDGAP